MVVVEWAGGLAAGRCCFADAGAAAGLWGSWVGWSVGWVVSRLTFQELGREKREERTGEGQDIAQLEKGRLAATWRGRIWAANLPKSLGCL